jgi:glutamine synthetase
MMSEIKKSYALTNPLSELLDKPPADFKREDFFQVIEQKKIERLTFHYTALDGRLKELKIPVTNRQKAESVLSQGERVDGSSLFKGMVDAELSDLYVVPEYKTAFFNPFDGQSLDFICRYLTKEGERAAFAPDNILQRASRFFQKNTGLDLYALGELEFFLIYEDDPNLYPMREESGYHEAAPFRKSGKLLSEMVRFISRITGAVKYDHSEVGYVSSIQSHLDEIRGKNAEQLEVELMPRTAEEMADILVLARWIIRNVAFEHGCLATFAPKIELGVAGNGLHFHLQLRKERKNIMTEKGGGLSESALRLIGGICRYAKSLTAFGNTVASSYLRLIPHYEAPTRIFWSDLNRSALIRVPLAWTNVFNLADRINPRAETQKQGFVDRQTVEFRSPDGSALVHLLLAGITMAAEWGLVNDTSLELADTYYLKEKSPADKKVFEKYPSLPADCGESGRILVENRKLYEKGGVFPPSVIDYMEKILKSEGQEMVTMEGSVDMRKLMHKYLHIR